MPDFKAPKSRLTVMLGKIQPLVCESCQWSYYFGALKNYTKSTLQQPRSLHTCLDHSFLSQKKNLSKHPHSLTVHLVTEEL